MNYSEEAQGEANMFYEKIRTLTMKPMDWTRLSRLTTPEEFASIKQRYLARENASQPKCGLAHRQLCAKCVGHKCMSKSLCEHKVINPGNLNW